VNPEKRRLQRKAKAKASRHRPRPVDRDLNLELTPKGAAILAYDRAIGGMDEEAE